MARLSDRLGSRRWAKPRRSLLAFQLLPVDMPQSLQARLPTSIVCGDSPSRSGHYFTALA